MSATQQEAEASKEVIEAAVDIAQLVRDNIGEKYRTSFIALLHNRLGTAAKDGANYNEVLNLVHQVLDSD